MPHQDARSEYFSGAPLLPPRQSSRSRGVRKNLPRPVLTARREAEETRSRSQQQNKCRFAPVPRSHLQYCQEDS